MRLASTGPEEGGGPSSWIVVLVVAILAIVSIGWAALGCYPRPVVDPPSCAVDPTQEWCVPPAFARSPDGGARDGGHR